MQCKRLKKYGYINEEQEKIIMSLLKKNKEYYKNVKPCFIHGDLTPNNTCYNFKNKKLYFIDFDMFEIGDPFIDTSKIIWSQNRSNVFKEYVKKYCKDYNEEIHLTYLIKIKLFWLNFAHGKNIENFENSLKKFHGLIKEANNIL